MHSRELAAQCLLFENTPATDNIRTALSHDRLL
jgi:hypothetical protein